MEREIRAVASSRNGRCATPALHHCAEAGRGRVCPRPTLLVYPDDTGFSQLGMFLPEFAGDVAERSALWVGEIRRGPISLSHRVAGPNEYALFLSHGRITSMSRMTWRRGDAWLTVKGVSPNRILGKRRSGGKQTEHKQDLFHRMTSQQPSKRGLIRDRAADVSSSG